MKKFFVTVSILLAVSLLGTCASAAGMAGALGTGVSQGVSLLGEALWDLHRYAWQNGYHLDWDDYWEDRWEYWEDRWDAWEKDWDHWDSSWGRPGLEDFNGYSDRQALPDPITGLHLINNMGEMTVQPSGTEESYYVLSCHAAGGYTPSVSVSLKDGVLSMELEQNRVDMFRYVRHLEVELYLSSEELESLTLSCNAGSFESRGLSFGQIDVTVNAGEAELSVPKKAELAEFSVQAGAAHYSGDAGRLLMEVHAGEMDFNGSVDTLCEVSTSAGNTDLSFTSLPQEVNIACAMGDISLKIPPEEGFTLIKNDSSFSDLTVGFDLVRTNEDGNTRYTYLDGGREIIVAVSAGTIEIQPSR